MTRHLALVGPTAAGKSGLASAIALALGDVEIVALDSMQVYRGMDIGTTKPTPAERAAVPHHLVDVADPSEDWSVARTQIMGRAAIADIEARGRRALLVGGTGLYVRAIVDDLDIPGQDLGIRAALLRDTEDPEGVARAFAQLRLLDPVAAGRIDAKNRRRIVRALEVIRATGRPFSSFGAGFDRYSEPRLDISLVGVWLARDELALRIAERFRRMCENGLVEEVRGLADTSRTLSRTASQAIGYREVLEYVAGIAPSLRTAIDGAVRRTRQLARRQRMWFRRDPRIRWFARPGNPQELLSGILATWTGSAPVSVR